jgi:hypothetical protein
MFLAMISLASSAAFQTREAALLLPFRVDCGGGSSKGGL